MTVWIAQNLQMTVDDATLNQIVPAASLSSSTCTDPIYQRTSIHATCDFAGGGVTISGVDVTALVSFTSASSLVTVVNSYVQVGSVMPHVTVHEGAKTIPCSC